MSFTKQQREEALKRDIEAAKNSKIKLTAVIVATGRCDECMKLDGKEFTLEQMVSEKYIASEKLHKI